MATYRTLAIVDDVNTCDCCGKTGLKHTVAMQSDDGALMHFGSVCATRHSGRGLKTIKAEAVAAALAKQEAANREYKATREYAVKEAKLAEAHRAGIPVGRAFRNYVGAAVDAANLVAVRIAIKYGVQQLPA